VLHDDPKEHNNDEDIVVTQIEGTLFVGAYGTRFDLRREQHGDKENEQSVLDTDQSHAEHQQAYGQRNGYAVVLKQEVNDEKCRDAHDRDQREYGRLDVTFGDFATTNAVLATSRPCHGGSSHSFVALAFAKRLLLSVCAGTVHGRERI